MQGALVATVALALLHFLWEGLLIGLAAAALLRTAQTARQRHLICIGGLACCLLAPLITAAVVAPSAQPSALAQAPVAALPALPVSAPAQAAPLSRADPLCFAVILWLIGVLWSAGYYMVQWRGVQQVRRGSFALEDRALSGATEALVQSARRTLRQWRQTAQVAVMASHAVLSPMVLGVCRPVIIFPAALLARMSVRDFELILLHEVAHILRRDTWANALQICLEILLFYHPVVHWLSRRARLERECACDDFAVAASGQAYEYARALTALAFRPVAPFGLPATGGELLHRLRHLGGERPSADVLPRAPAHWLLLAVLLAGFLLVEQPLTLPPPALRRAHGLSFDPGARPAHEARETPPAPARTAPPSLHADAPAVSRVRRARLQDDAPPREATEGAAPPAPASVKADAHPPAARPLPTAAPGAPEPLLPVSRAPAPPRAHPTPRAPRAATAARPALAARPMPAAGLTPIYDPAPEYPVEARSEGLQGQVVVRIRVGTDGRPHGLSILKASPEGVFEGAVRRALMRWRYRVQEGHGSERTAVYRLTFSLAGISSAPASICATATASRTCEDP